MLYAGLDLSRKRLDVHVLREDVKGQQDLNAGGHEI